MPRTRLICRARWDPFPRRQGSRLEVIIVMRRIPAKFAFTYRHFPTFFFNIRMGANGGEASAAKPERR